MNTSAKRLQQAMVVLSVLAVLAVSAATASAQAPGDFTTIDYPDACATYAFGINPAGDIVGVYVDSSCEFEHGFLLRNGTFTSFDYPGADATENWGVSPRGDIVGQYYLPDGTVHGFLLRDGTFTPIDVPGQPNTMPSKISPQGTVVGCSHFPMYGFRMTADGTITLDPVDGIMHNGVNARGDIVGIGLSGLDSYLIHNGQMTWFQLEGSALTQAWDISPTGTIVGFHRLCLTSQCLAHGFIMGEGETVSFDVPGARLTRAYGINATGDIVGYYTNFDHSIHGFLLKRRGSK